MMEQRTCTNCGEAKPLHMFYTVGRGKEARRKTCRDCDRARTRTYNKIVAEPDLHAMAMALSGAPRQVGPAAEVPPCQAMRERFPWMG